MSLQSSFAAALLAWFDQYGRKHLPWQKNRSAYRVWVSEVMLQQTQANTAITYFESFMKRFPAVADLANASQDEVLRLWAGLGYYARGRNLHKSAQVIVNHYQGSFPNTIAALTKLPGIGRSTAGAIVSLAYNQPAAILDGNAKRVLARMYAIDGWPGKAQVNKQLWALAESHTPKKRCADYTQAMMDLGATLCTRSQPGCSQCPARTQCLAFKQGNPKDYPGKKPKKRLPSKHTQFLMVINHRGEILLEKRPAVGIWGGFGVSRKLR